MAYTKGATKPDPDFEYEKQRRGITTKKDEDEEKLKEETSDYQKGVPEPGKETDKPTNATEWFQYFGDYSDTDQQEANDAAGTPTKKPTTDKPAGTGEYTGSLDSNTENQPQTQPQAVEIDPLDFYIDTSDYQQAYTDQLNYANTLTSDLYGRMNTDIAESNTRWDDYYAFLQSDPTQNAGYQSIRDSFSYKGSRAADSALAGGAAANAGNIDSYAAANAKRQQLAFDSAGAEAALRYWNNLASLMATGIDAQSDNINQTRSIQSGLIKNPYQASSQLGEYAYNSNLPETTSEVVYSEPLANTYEALSRLQAPSEMNPVDFGIKLNSILTDLKRKDPANSFSYDAIWDIYQKNSDYVSGFIKELEKYLGI